MTLLQWLKNSRQSELIVILGEDSAAIIGLIFALLSVILTMVTGNPLFDAIGSIGIGVLLVIISIFLGIKIKGFLIGQSTDQFTRDEIIQYLDSREEVEDVLNILTLQLGAQIMVAVKAKMTPALNNNELINNINNCEKGLRESCPQIKWVFFEPDVIK